MAAETRIMEKEETAVPVEGASKHVSAGNKTRYHGNKYACNNKGTVGSGVTFDKMITWRLHIEMTEAKAFKTSVRINLNRLLRFIV
jgi:hypothetical protein